MVYDCSICGKRHKEDSAVGKAHLEKMKETAKDNIAKEAVKRLDQEKTMDAISEEKQAISRVREAVKDDKMFVKPAMCCPLTTEHKPGAIGSLAADWTPNFKMKRWERPGTGDLGEPQTIVRPFSPLEEVLFMKRIHLTNGKKWHWWNEKEFKRTKKKWNIP